jgi:heme exporter protein B
MTVFWAVLQKDLRIELRRRQIIVSTIVFSALALLVFEFVFDLRGADVRLLAPGILWAVFAFNGVLVFNRVFESEREQSSLTALTLAPVDRGTIYLAKWAFSLILMLVTEIVVIALFGALFNTNLFLPAILLALLLASAGMSAAGTALAAAALNARAREVMLPVLLLPLSIPVLLGAVRITGIALTGASLGQSLPWLNLLAAFDILFGVACYYSFGFLIEE